MTWSWSELRLVACAERWEVVWHGFSWAHWKLDVLLHFQWFAEVWLQMMESSQKSTAIIQPRNNWTRSCDACSVGKGLIFLMLCSANLHDRAVFVIWSLKVSWSSMITPRFLAGKTRSSVFARLSCRWCSFIHAEMSARQPEIRASFIKHAYAQIWS